MADILSLLVFAIIVALAAGWAILLRRRPRKPTTFIRLEESPHGN